MITAYTGVPGGGKSLHAAQDILDSLTKKNVPVIANFNINQKRVNRVLVTNIIPLRIAYQLHRR